MRRPSEGTIKLIYGPEEYAYAEPIAEALRDNRQFLSWIISQTSFSEGAMTARLLFDEMKKHRSKGAKTWWRSHYHEKCRCEGCSGKETDLLAIFECDDRFRFALHCEVKNPKDSFNNRSKRSGRSQAEAYPIRARCWATPGKNPDHVLPHDAAETLVFFAEHATDKLAADIRHFDRRITFESINNAFPSIHFPQ
ncbi:MAG: hypothetical protein ACRCYS_06220 [Beijerinckiaceae bacterium]